MRYMECKKVKENEAQMIAPDLFEFAYVPDWYGHLAELERLASAGVMEIPKAEQRNKKYRDAYFRTVHTYNFSQTGH